jgi:flagellar protein FlgJ
MDLMSNIENRSAVRATELQNRLEGSRSNAGNKAGAGPDRVELTRYFPGLFNGKISADQIHKQELVPPGSQFKEGQSKMQEVAQEFQSLFVKMMLSSMRKQLNPENDMLGGGRAQEIFKDMLFDQYAMLISKDDSFTLDEQIVKQLEQTRGQAAGNAYRENLP